MSYNENNNMGNEKNSDIENENNLALKFITIFLVIIVCSTLFILVLTRTCIVFHNYTDATCERAKTCVRCGETEGQPLGHSWIDATCEKAKTCKICGKTEGQPLGHTAENWKIEKEATCTEGGTKSGHCSVCNKDVTEVIPATGHSLGQWEIGTKATLNSSGEKVQKCTKCGETINKDIYYLTEEEKAEIIRQEKEAKIAAEKAEKEAKEKAEKQRKASMYNITVLSAERSSSNYVRIYYRIKNNSDSDKSLIKVRGTLYDSNGNGITSGNSYIYDLPANQSKEDDILIQYSGNDYSTYSVEVVEVV